MHCIFVKESERLIHRSRKSLYEFYEPLKPKIYDAKVVHKIQIFYKN